MGTKKYKLGRGRSASPACDDGDDRTDARLKICFALLCSVLSPPQSTPFAVTPIHQVRTVERNSLARDLTR